MQKKASREKGCGVSMAAPLPISIKAAVQAQGSPQQLPYKQTMNNNHEP